MSRWYPGLFVVFPHDTIFFVTITVIDWVDVFTREEYKRIIADSLDFCRRKKGLCLYAWVLMSNHIHLIVSHDESNDKLAATIGDLKKFTAKNVINAIIENPQESRKEWLLKHFEEERIKDNPDASCSISKDHGSDCSVGRKKHYHLWRRGYHSFCIYNIKMMRQKIDYLHANPVRAGIVDKPWDYRYSSSRNYIGEDGEIEIDYMDLGIDDSSKPRRW